MPQLSEENRLELENALSSLKSSSRQAIESAVTVALRFRKEHYKEVAHLMEKHLHKTKIERKLPALYAIDLLFNKAAQGGKSNPFPKRFEKNIKETFAQLRQCKKEELVRI